MNNLQPAYNLINDMFNRAQRNYDRWLPEDNRTDAEIEDDIKERMVDEERAKRYKDVLSYVRDNVLWNKVEKARNNNQ